MNVLFINASPNKEGVTVKWAAKVLAGITYESLHLVDFTINQLGQVREEDEFQQVMAAVKHADCLVIGTPIYWWDVSGLLKTFIDRWTELFQAGLEGSEAPLYHLPVYWIVQGANANESINEIKKMLKNVCARFFIENKAIVYQKQQILSINDEIKVLVGNKF